MVSKTYCTYPFEQLSMLHYVGDYLITAWPCCSMGNPVPDDPNPVYIGIDNQHEMTPQQIFDHPAMQELRTNLSYGIRDARCRTCWREEDAGIKSLRMQSHDLNENDAGIPTNLHTIDLKTSALCNLRCRMCNPGHSHSLMIDQAYFKEHGLLPEMATVAGRWHNNPTPHSPSPDTLQWQWLWENTHQINHIRASGGEPFYDKKFIALLKHYIDTGAASNTTLSCHTNATMFSDAVVDILSHFLDLNLLFSIDGTGKTYEYIRHPQSFDDLEIGVKKYRDRLPNAHIHNVMVLSALNALNIGDYLEWCMSICNSATIDYSMIYPHSRGTALCHLPVDILVEAKLRLHEKTAMFDHLTVDHNCMTQLNNAINDNHKNRDKMLREIALFDKSRSQSYRDYLDPMLVSWLDSNS